MIILDSHYMTPSKGMSSKLSSSSSSSLGSRCVPWLGEGLSMPSPNDPVLCCPLPSRVAPVFVQVVSPPLGWSPLSLLVIIMVSKCDTRGPSVVFEAVRSPAAVAYGDRSLRVVALSRTIAEYRRQEPSWEIVRLVVALNDRCTISYCARRPIIRSFVATDRTIHCRPCRSYEQSWHPACDRSYDHSWSQDYKEKHKLDSKQISDSAFGAHLRFCQK